MTFMKRTMLMNTEITTMIISQSQHLQALLLCSCSFSDSSFSLAAFCSDKFCDFSVVCKLNSLLLQLIKKKFVGIAYFYVLCDNITGKESLFFKILGQGKHVVGNFLLHGMVVFYEGVKIVSCRRLSSSSLADSVSCKFKFKNCSIFYRKLQLPLSS
jgi:hypothetical protein